jgi:hypothetical protein
MPFFDKLLGPRGGEPEKASRSAVNLLSSFVVNFPEDAALNRLTTEQAIAETDAVRLRFTMAVANSKIVLAAMKAAAKENLSPLVNGNLQATLAELTTLIRIGDYVKDATELAALGAAFAVPGSTPLENTRGREVAAGQLFELLGKIRGEEYDMALMRDAGLVMSKGLPAVSRKVAVHYVGESLLGTQAPGFVERLAVKLNEIYGPGYTALVKNVKRL